MATSDVSAVTNHFATAHEGFTTTLGSTITPGAAVVPLTATSGLTNGDIFVGIIDPGLAAQQVFTGTIDTSGSQITGVVWTRGANTAHTAGATIVDYVSGTSHNMMVKGIKVHANQDGTLKGDAVRDALSISADPAGGWEPFAQTFTVASGYNKGNREFDLTASASVASFLSPGMRFKVTRPGTVPTQCFDAELSSSQYAARASASVAGITFTDDFTCEAWIKVESYVTGTIVARYSGSNGWIFYLNSTGQINIQGTAAGVSDVCFTTQTVPLGRWIHVAATMDISAATGAVYLDGVSMPVNYTNSAITALVQGTDLTIGAHATPALYFDGMISDVRVWNVVRTATQIKDNMCQYPTDTTNLVGWWKLDGNFNDSSSNANNLTGSGGAVATTLDNPYKATEYAIVTKVATTTVTVFTGTDHTIPSGALTGANYSLEKQPYGFPGARSKWRVEGFLRTLTGQATPAANTWYNPGSLQIQVPTGVWKVRLLTNIYVDRAASGDVNVRTTVSTANNSELDRRYTAYSSANAVLNYSNTALAEIEETTLTSATLHYANLGTTAAGLGNVYFLGDRSATIFMAECAYV